MRLQNTNVMTLLVLLVKSNCFNYEKLMENVELKQGLNSYCLMKNSFALIRKYDRRGEMWARSI